MAWCGIKGGGHVGLTSAGRKIARKLTLRHHLIERMLAEIFGMEWYRVHGKLSVSNMPSRPTSTRLLAKLERGGACPRSNLSELDPGGRRRRGLVLLAHADEERIMSSAASTSATGTCWNSWRVAEFVPEHACTLRDAITIKP